MLCEWDCLKKWRTPLGIAICQKNFLRLWQFVKSEIIRSDNKVRKQRHRMRVEGQVLLLPPDLRPLQRILQKLPLEQWLDILDLHLWTSAQAGGGFPQKKGQRGLLMEGVCIVVWFNHRAAECAARKKAQTYKAAGAEIKEVETGTGSQRSGNEQVNWRRMALRLTVKVWI